MTERNMARANQILLDGELDLNHHFLHPEPHVLFGNAIGFSAPNAHPSPANSGIQLNLGFQPFLDHSGSNSLYANQYTNLQYNQAATNFEVGSYAPSNFSSNSYMASSSSRPNHVNNGSTEQLAISSSNGIMGITMDGHGFNSEFLHNSWGFNKRKHDLVTEQCYYADGFANTDTSINLTMGFGRQLRNESYEAGPNLLDPTSFTPEGNMLAMADASPESLRGRAITVDLRLESAFIHNHNHNHFIQENYVGCPFQRAASWPDQFINNVNDGSTSNQAYTHPAPYFLGYPGHTSGRNAAMAHQPAALYSHPYPILPGQVFRSHGHYPVPSFPFGRPVNNFQSNSLSVARDVQQSGPRFTRFVHSNTSEATIRPPRRLQPARDHNDGHTRGLHPEHVALLDLSVFYEAGNNADQHRDMRLDIDGMSYEELLALEEHIGDVIVGLSEESILKHLKTRIHVSELASLSLKSPCSSLENETCVICQIEFEENERIGMLGCGHDYHADCIKHWLLIKNICPICKTTALVDEKKKGEHV